MAEVILPAVAASAAAGSTAAALTLAAVNFGISAVASYAANALTPKPNIPGTGGFLVNEVNPTAPAEYVYGEVRKGGVVTYDEATDDNAILHRIIVLAAGEHEVGDIYLNDEVVEISGNDFSLTDPSDSSDVYTGAGWVTTEKWMEDNRIREPRVRIFVHDGSQTSAADTFANSSSRSLANELIAKSANGLDASFVGRGLTYLYVQMNIDNEVFAGGVPRITAMVKRKGVYDPRDDTNKITSNWALCVADYLQADYGLGDAGSVDSTALSAEANICEEAVALDAGGTQARYEVNGVFRADEEPGQILSRLMPSGSGSLFWGQGKWNIRAGAYAGAVASFDLSDLRSGIEVETRTPRAQNYNAIRGVFNDKSQRYIEGEYPRISSATFLAVDGGFENVLDYDLPFETDGVRAQRLAKLALYRQREQIRVEADFNMRAASVQPGDVIDLTIDRYGWDAKEFEVVGWQLKISETGTLCVRLSLKETSEAAFDWNAEESVFEGNNTNLPDRLTVPTVTLGTPIISYVQNPGGTEQPLVTVPWTVVSPGLVSDYVFEWRENNIDYAGNGGIVELGGTPTAREQEVYDAYFQGLRRAPDQNGFDFYVSGGGASLTAAEVLVQITNSPEGQAQDNFQSTVVRTTRAELRTLSFDQRYDFRVYARNARGARSAGDAITYLIEKDTTAPPAPDFDGVEFDISGAQVTVRWNDATAYADGTPVYDLRDTGVWRSTDATLTLDGNGEPTNAVRVGRSKTEELIDTTAEAQTEYTYFVRSRDFSENYSAFSGGKTITTGGDIFAIVAAEAQQAFDNFNASFDAALDRTEEGIIGALITDFLETARVEGVVEENRVAQQTAIDGVSASLTQNYLTAVQTNSALAQLETSLTASIDGVSANLTTNYATIASVNSAIAQLEIDIAADFASNNATIASTYLAQADLNSATADLVNQTGTTLNGLSTTVNTVQSSVNGIEGVYGVKVNNNGVVSGFGLISSLVDGDPVSSFILDVNNFYVGTSTTSGSFAAPFVVTGGEVFIQKARIKNADIDTLKLAGNAATAADFGQVSNNTPGAGITVQRSGASAAVTVPGNTTAKIFISANYRQGYTAQPRQWGYLLFGGFSGTSTITTRTGMSATNDQAVVTHLVTVTNTSSSPAPFIGFADWFGEDSNIVLQSCTISLFAQWR